MPRPTTSPTKDPKPYPTTKPRTKSKGAWTTDEQLTLLAHVTAGVKSGFFSDDVVAGRSKSQVYDQWRQTLLPFLRKAVAERSGAAGPKQAVKGKSVKEEVTDMGTGA